MISPTIPLSNNQNRNICISNFKITNLPIPNKNPHNSPNFSLNKNNLNPNPNIKISNPNIPNRIPLSQASILLNPMSIVFLVVLVLFRLISITMVRLLLIICQKKEHQFQTCMIKNDCRKVACEKCTYEQMVVGNTQVYVCCMCNAMNECFPLYGIFICGQCKTNVCYPYGTSEFIKCTKCGIVNKVPTEPQKHYKKEEKVKKVEKIEKI